MVCHLPTPGSPAPSPAPRQPEPPPWPTPPGRFPLSPAASKAGRPQGLSSTVSSESQGFSVPVSSRWAPGKIQRLENLGPPQEPPCQANFSHPVTRSVPPARSSSRAPKGVRLVSEGSGVSPSLPSAPAPRAYSSGHPCQGHAGASRCEGACLCAEGAEGSPQEDGSEEPCQLQLIIPVISVAFLGSLCRAVQGN